MNDHELALVAAEAGARIVRHRFGSALARIDKGHGDFATDVDLDAERAILDVLRRHRPSDAILAEESGESGAPRCDRRWLVDPLCGTFNYAAGTGPVGVNVALRHGDGVAAAVADPLLGETIWKDGHLTYLRIDQTDRVAVPDATSRLVDLNLDPPFPNGRTFRTVTLLADVAFEARFRPRVVSTSLALAWTASGKRAAYITDGDMRDNVHFSAGIDVCIAAGCIVTNLYGGPLHSGPDGLLAAADGETHATLLEQILR